MTNNDDIMLVGSLDQPIVTDNGWILERIDVIIQESVQKHDAIIALNVCKQLVEISKTSGLALAKALYLIKINWDEYDVGDEFTNTVLDYTGLHQHTIDRYVSVWAMFANHNVPKDLLEEVIQRNIKDLIPVAKAIEQGYEIDRDNWEAIAEATDFAEVAKIVREDIKQKEPRKGSLQLYMDRTGTIWAFQNDERKFVGSLEVTDEDEVVQKAINRIINGSGIIKQ